MSTTNGNMEPGAKTDLVDLVGELEVAPEPKPEPVKATRKKSSK